MSADPICVEGDREAVDRERPTRRVSRLGEEDHGRRGAERVGDGGVVPLPPVLAAAAWYRCVSPAPPGAPGPAAGRPPRPNRPGGRSGRSSSAGASGRTRHSAPSAAAAARITPVRRERHRAGAPRPWSTSRKIGVDRHPRPRDEQLPKVERREFGVVPQRRLRGRAVPLDGAPGFDGETDGQTDRDHGEEEQQPSAQLPAGEHGQGHGRRWEPGDVTKRHLRRLQAPL